MSLSSDKLAVDPAEPCCAVLAVQDLLDLLQCLIQRKQQPEAALQQLDELAGRHIESLRNLTKLIQDVRLRRDNDGIRAAIQQYDDALERYIPGGATGGGGWAKRHGRDGGNAGQPLHLGAVSKCDILSLDVTVCCC